MEKQAPLIFISYAHADDDLRAQFETALSSLTRQGSVLAWTDPQISAGADWKDELFSALDCAKVCVLMVSPAFLKSDFCYLQEMPRALARHERGECIVIPVLVRPTPNWEALPFAALQVLPTRGLPVTNWANRDDAWSDVVQGIADAVHLPKHWPRSATRDGVRRGVFQPPEPDSVFVGRALDVAAVENMLLSDKQIVVIRGGLGGLGKTALAQHTALKMHPHFTGGVLWGRLPTVDANSLLRSMLAGAGLFDGEGAVSGTYEAAKRRLDEFCAIAPVLILLDNADTADDVLPFVPARGAARVLVTTRHAIVPSLPNATEWQIEPLGNDAGQELIAILKAVHAQEDPEAARLVSAMGGLPLAIRIAAGIMQELGWSAGDYLQQFEQAASLDWLATGDSQEIRRSFSVSYDRLPDTRSQRLFRAMGAFLQETLPRQALPAASGLSKQEVDLALLSLSRRGLCRMTGRDSVTLHPLMSRYANELLRRAQEAEAVHLRIGAAYREGLTLWDRTSATYRGYGSGLDEDAVAGLAAARHFEEAGSLSEAQDCLEAVADVLTRRGNEVALARRLDSLRARGPLKPWLEVYWADLEIDSHWRHYQGLPSQSGDSSVLYVDARNSLAALSLQADPKVASAALICLARIELRARREAGASELLNRSLRLKEAMDPPDRRGIAYILNEVGRVGVHIGVTSSEALAQHRKALEIQREIGDDQGVAYTLRRIASIELWHLNDPAAALTTLEEAEKLAAALSFKLALVTILIEKAEALRRLEYYIRAEENLLRASRLAREIDNPFTEAQVQRRLASLYERVELYVKALDCLERSIGLFDLIDPAEAQKHQKAKQRLQNTIRGLEEDARATEAKIQDAKQAGGGPQLRVEARKLRRLEEKLNRASGSIRLGRK